MLKKLAVIVLLMVYGLSSSGMTIQFHYCCGKLKSIQLSPVSEKKCGMKHSMKMLSKPCCNDKQVELKLKGDQKTGQAKFVFCTPDAPQREEFVFYSQPLVSKTIIPEIFAPPPLSSPLYMLHCVYRIWLCSSSEEILLHNQIILLWILLNMLQSFYWALWVQ